MTEISLISYKILPDCSNPMIGDGYCDDRFNLPMEACPHDGGDCCGPNVNTMFCEHCLCLDNVTLNTDCRHSEAVGNGRCNDFANNKECGYDGGDCCSEESNYDYCFECACILADAGDSLAFLQEFIDIYSRCPYSYLEAIGDGFCQPELNIKDCDFDGGDCIKPIKQASCPFVNIPNQRCDDKLNIFECNYDNGECCGHADLTYCDECLCKDPSNEQKRDIRKCKYIVLKGDGKCDDANNIPECDYDGGDCCGCYVTKGNCFDCTCKDPIESKFANSGEWCCVKVNF